MDAGLGQVSFRNTAFMTFAGNRIACIDAYFGAAYQHGVFLRQQGQAGRVLTSKIISAGVSGRHDAVRLIHERQ